MEDLILDAKAGTPHEHAETRCFKSVGMGLYDARAAQLIYENALLPPPFEAVFFLILKERHRIVPLFYRNSLSPQNFTSLN